MHIQLIRTNDEKIKMNVADNRPITLTGEHATDLYINIGRILQVLSIRQTGCSHF